MKHHDREDRKGEYDAKVMQSVLNVLDIDMKEVKNNEQMYHIISNAIVKGFVKLLHKDAVKAVKTVRAHISEGDLTALRKELKTKTDPSFTQREHLLRSSFEGNRADNILG